MSDVDLSGLQHSVDVACDMIDTLRVRVSELEAENEALQQKLGEMEIVAIYEIFVSIQKEFTEFMETGPEEGIGDKLWKLVHNTVSKMDEKKPS